VYEGELVGEDPDATGRRVLVDQPAPPAVWAPPWQRDERRTAVIPVWVRDAEQRRQAVGWAVRHARHVAAFHAVRSPIYAARLAAASPRGMFRSVAGAGRWCTAAELGAAVKAAGADPRSAVALQQMRQQRAQQRTLILGVAAAVAMAGWWVAGGHGLLRWILAAAVVGILGAVGRRDEKPIVSHAVDRLKTTRLTDPIVLRALTVAGLGGKKTKTHGGDDDDQPVTGTPVIVRSPARDGKGFAVLVDLPYGRTSKQAIKKHEEIASGLDVDPVQLFLEPDRSSARRLAMWVADADPYAGQPNPSPLARCPKVSVWEPQRLGVEPRGRVVSLPLIFNGYVVGSIPRQGKTFTVRNLVAPAILDPFCDLTVLGAKSSDWEDAEQVAVSYCAGEGDDAMVAYSVAALRTLLAESQARYDAIRALPRAERPEGKVTPELQSKGFRPHVIVVEECQNILGHRDASGTKASPLAKEALYLCTALAKVAPAAGYILILATQRPSADVIPSDLRDVLSVRIALKVNDRVSSDTILGDYRSARGIESASLLNQVHAGVATIVGVDNGRGGDHVRIRGDLLDSDDFARICKVGRQRRLDAGTLRGHAAGEADPVAVEVSLLDDLLAVWPAGEASAWSESLCARLADLRPELYGGWDAAQLSVALKPFAVTTKQLAKQRPDGRANRRGLLWADIERATQTRATR
jgi:S-DNA-T family DNA segregation ATPase FtsK/SpoIIIE